MGDPVSYAEHTLKVHEIYDESRSALEDLEHAHAAVTTHAAAIRDVQEQIAVREAVVISEQRAAHADLSDTAFQREVKNFLAMDEDLQRHRGDLRSAQRSHDEAKDGVRQHEQRLRIATARMEELGGLLNFYGASKTARAIRDTANAAAS